MLSRGPESTEEGPPSLAIGAGCQERAALRTGRSERWPLKDQWEAEGECSKLRELVCEGPQVRGLSRVCPEKWISAVRLAGVGEGQQEPGLASCSLGLMQGGAHGCSSLESLGA